MKKALLGYYKNPHEKKVLRGLTHYLLWHIGYYNDPYPQEPPPEDFAFPNPQDNLDYDRPLATWINHSTFWVKYDDKSILVDPIWSERCSPVNFIGPKRRHPPPFKIDQFEKIDVVILTHNHYDHMDKMSVSALHQFYPQIQWIVPKGVKRWFKKYLPNASVHELSWWETKKVGNIDFTAVPAQHFSGRGIFDRNRTAWMGVVMKVGDKQVYFAGDTGYNPTDFKEIGKKFGAMDLALLPVGAYSPRKFMRGVHVNPEDAVLIHKEVNSKQSLGGHWWTFRLSEEYPNRPPYDLYCALEKEGVDPLAFRVVEPGDSINW